MKVISPKHKLTVALVVGLAAAAAGSPGPDLEEWLIRTWETEDGLPEDSATAMVQGPDGYLWLGTFKGLARFDGVRFTVFDTSNTPGLPSDGIVSLHMDQKGRLWVGTLAGLVVREDASWRTLWTPERPGEDFVRNFAERRNGDLLMATAGGRMLEFTGGRLVELPPPPGTPHAGCLGYADEAGHWWAVQDKFVGRWDGQAWVPVVPADDFNAPGTANMSCTEACDGGLWLLLGSELRKYVAGTEVSRVRLPEGPGTAWSMAEDSYGNVWVCTIAQGICQILPSGLMLRWDENNGITYHGTRFVFEDRERNLWLGTSGGGLQRIKPRRFQSYGPAQGLSERVVKSVSPAPDGGLWVATFGKGLFRWTEQGITNVPLAGWTNPSLYAQSVLTDRNGRTWLGTSGAGLFMFDANGHQHFPAETIGGNNVCALFEDSQGRVWISGGEAISAFADGVFHVYGTREGLPASVVCCFAEDSEGSLWVCNLESVFRLEKGHFVEVLDNQNNSIRGITSLKGEPDGTMWMGSLHGGLMRWRQGRLVKIGTDAGLPVASVHALLEDGQGFFWMPSNRGVIRVRRTELEAVADGNAGALVCQLLDGNDGLASMECPAGQQPTCARDARGKLWFATLKGLAAIDPASFRVNSTAPRAIIERIIYHASSRDARGNGAIERQIEQPFASPVELPPDSHGIEIHYTAPSFASPEKVRFQINLNGQPQGWEDVANRRTVYYDQLEAGSHSFRVRAANDDGLWDSSGTGLTLAVLPFFWQTGWFRSLAIACACGAALVWLFRLRARLESKRAAQDAFTRQLILSQENERKRVASELHDSLGQDLLLIKNRLTVLADEVTPEVRRKLLEISSTTSQAIGDVRSISHGLRPVALEQVGLTKAIEWMIEQFAETSKTKFSPELENIDGRLKPDMEINLYRIVQEALNNVGKHAHASEVIVEVHTYPEGISVSIFDDGQGFTPGQSHPDGKLKSGFGLTGMAERAKVLGGQLDIQSAPGRGARLTLFVPVANRANAQP